MTRPDLRPLNAAPVAIRGPYDQRRSTVPPWEHRDLEAARTDYLAALAEPLAGIPLGTYDQRLIAWLVGWDIPTIGGIASLLHRARAAAPLLGGAR